MIGGLPCRSPQDVCTTTFICCGAIRAKYNTGQLTKQRYSFAVKKLLKHIMRVVLVRTALRCGMPTVKNDSAADGATAAPTTDT